MDKKTLEIYGNEKLLNFFISAVENGKLAHAYIFEGERGSGKHLLARRLSCLLACRSLMERPCFMCDSCRKISEDISPDVIEIGIPKDKKTIGVDQIRDLRSSVFVKPSEEDVKIYIISNAEAMTDQAQNVFLKVLEEPPKNVYFFLLCENTSNILATVKSRAPILKMQSFTDAELSDYLLNNSSIAQNLYKNNIDEFKLVIRISEGKIGHALRLLKDSKGDNSQSKHEKAKKLIENCGHGCSYSDMLLYVQNMAIARDVLSDILLYAMYASRDLIAIKKTDKDNIPLLFYNDYDYACSVASNFTAAGVLKIYEELCRTRIEVMANANLNILLTNLACELKKAASI